MKYLILLFLLTGCTTTIIEPFQEQKTRKEIIRSFVADKNTEYPFYIKEHWETHE